jgi:hypothetical protein
MVPFFSVGEDEVVVNVVIMVFDRFFKKIFSENT